MQKFNSKYIKINKNKSKQKLISMRPIIRNIVLEVKTVKNFQNHIFICLVLILFFDNWRI